MSVAVYGGAQKVSKDPNANIDEATELLRNRPTGGEVTHDGKLTTNVMRRAWGERLARLVAAISKIQVANERLAVMIGDTTLYAMVIARRIERHTS